MTTARTKRWVLVDAPVERLLDEVGVPELQYYSAAEERAVHEALGTWPLLAAVAQALRTERARSEPMNDADQLLRVVVDHTGEDDRPDDPPSPGAEAGR